MLFVIFDDGNLVEPFDDEGEATEALKELAAVAEAAPHLLLVAFDASGEAVADCVPASACGRRDPDHRCLAWRIGRGPIREWRGSTGDRFLIE